MNLKEKVLQKLAEWQPTAKERSRLVIPDEGTGWTATVTADRNDELGCMVWDFGLRRSGDAPAGTTLQSWAEQTAARVNSLLEPLKVVEVDCERNEAQLRSQEPNQRGEAVYYYELLLSGTTLARLRRYQSGHATSQPRSQVAFPITHEALAKLASTLAGEG